MATQDHPRLLGRIYRRRFAQTAAYRNRVWRVLTDRFFSRWIGPGNAVLDLGCGDGEFINNVLVAGKQFLVIARKGRDAGRS